MDRGRPGGQQCEHTQYGTADWKAAGTGSTNAVFERDAIRPILAGDLPECVKELIMPAVENHEAILEAALTCNEGLVVKAFMNAPQVKGRKR